MIDGMNLIATMSVVAIVIIVLLLRRAIYPASAGKPLEHPEGFARLLLSEILMYEGKSVNDAFERRSIYGSLKEEIDRSREMFLDRFPGQEAVFHDSIVAILARGDVDRLGPDYPYRTSR